MIKATLLFYNGDELQLDLLVLTPPGRLEHEAGDRRFTFWLDTEIMAKEGRVEYREVARRMEER